MVQPAVATSLLADPLAREQGFLARCLVSYPQSTAGSRTYVEVNLGEAAAYQRYAARVTALLQGPWPKASDHELEPPNLYLSAEAKRTWIAIYNDLETGLAPQGPFASIRSLAAKAPEHIARLAGTFAVFEGDNEIHEEQVDRALRLVLHYLDEATRLWGASQIKPELRLAQELLQWWRLKVGPGRVITLIDIYRNGPAAIRSAAVARTVVRTLLDHGWLVPGRHPKSKEAFELVETR